MTPNAPPPRPVDHSPPGSASQEQPLSGVQRLWRVLLSVLALGLWSTGGCTLSPGHDIPSITTAGDGDYTTTDSTGSPIAGAGGASSGSGGAPALLGVGGLGGDPCSSDAPGGEGGGTTAVIPLECGDPK